MCLRHHLQGNEDETSKLLSSLQCAFALACVVFKEWRALPVTQATGCEWVGRRRLGITADPIQREWRGCRRSPCSCRHGGRWRQRSHFTARTRCGSHSCSDKVCRWGFPIPSLKSPVAFGCCAPDVRVICVD